MSEFAVTVVRVEAMHKHPNADSLLVTEVFGCPVITKAGEVTAGCLAAFIPITSRLSLSEERTLHLYGKDGRIRPKKLRGVFSMGALIRAPAGSALGDDVTRELGVTRWEPPEDRDDDSAEREDDFPVPRFTDIKDLRRWRSALAEKEIVVIREKLHGNNMRAAIIAGELRIASRRLERHTDDDSVFAQAAINSDLDRALRVTPNIGFYLEVIGVKDLKYGADVPEVVVIDAIDMTTLQHLSDADFERITTAAGLRAAPLLYRGPWSASLLSLAEGESLMAQHVREGFVVKPVSERQAKGVGRLILKIHGEGYLLRSKNEI